MMFKMNRLKRALSTGALALSATTLRHRLSHRTRRQQAPWLYPPGRSRTGRPLYRGQLLVHGTGFSPDPRTTAVVSIGSNSVTFIDTASNVVKHVTIVGRSLDEAFFTSDGGIEKLR
jgi:hypothetical protein